MDTPETTQHRPSEPRSAVERLQEETGKGYLADYDQLAAAFLSGDLSTAAEILDRYARAAETHYKVQRLEAGALSQLLQRASASSAPSNETAASSVPDQLAEAGPTEPPAVKTETPVATSASDAESSSALQHQPAGALIEGVQGRINADGIENEIETNQPIEIPTLDQAWVILEKLSSTPESPLASVATELLEAKQTLPTSPEEAFSKDQYDDEVTHPAVVTVIDAKVAFDASDVRGSAATLVVRQALKHQLLRELNARELSTAIEGEHWRPLDSRFDIRSSVPTVNESRDRLIVRIQQPGLISSDASGQEHVIRPARAIITQMDRRSIELDRPEILGDLTDRLDDDPERQAALRQLEQIGAGEPMAQSVERAQEVLNGIQQWAYELRAVRNLPSTERFGSLVQLVTPQRGRDLVHLYLLNISPNGDPRETLSFLRERTRLFVELAADGVQIEQVIPDTKLALDERDRARYVPVRRRALDPSKTGSTYQSQPTLRPGVSLSIGGEFHTVVPAKIELYAANGDEPAGDPATVVGEISTTMRERGVAAAAWHFWEWLRDHDEPNDDGLTRKIQKWLDRAYEATVVGGFSVEQSAAYADVTTYKLSSEYDQFSQV